MNKYYAKYVFWNTITETVIPPDIANSLRSGNQKRLPEYITRFDSQHEFKVYLELVRMYGKKRIKCQYAIDILPRSVCFPCGKKWKVDFAIKDTEFSDVYTHYVEAKGLVTREFVYSLSCLEQADCDAFSSTFLVFPNKIPRNKTLIKNLYDSYLSENLMTLEQLKNTHKL